jgi:hypothetical protein
VRGHSRVLARVPATASDRSMLAMAAPHATRVAHWAGSATGSSRYGSMRTSMAPSTRANRHGWTLYTDGARTAAATAMRNRSTSIDGMTVTTSLPCHARQRCRSPISLPSTIGGRAGGR